MIVEKMERGQEKMKQQPKVSDAVIKRLPIYLRFLENLSSSGIKTISSQELGEKLDVNPAQIRKDLAHFGEFGRKGIGYEIEYVISRIKHILKLDRFVPVILIGAGNLGQALCNYNAFMKNNMKIVAVFDNDPNKVDTTIGGDLLVSPMNNLKQVVTDLDVKIGIITVPAPYAQHVADQLVDANIKGILNFAPVILKTPENIRVNQTDVTTELQTLAFYLD